MLKEEIKEREELLAVNDVQSINVKERLVHV